MIRNRKRPIYYNIYMCLDFFFLFQFSISGGRIQLDWRYSARHKRMGGWHRRTKLYVDCGIVEHTAQYTDLNKSQQKPMRTKHSSHTFFYSKRNERQGKMRKPKKNRNTLQIYERIAMHVESQWYYNIESSIFIILLSFHYSQVFDLFHM